MSAVKALENSITKTFVYFDILNFPLTQEELFRFLWMPPRMGWEEFIKMCEHTNYGYKNGYYFLPGRENLIAERQHATEITKQKQKIARRAVKFIRSVPFLKAIFICNSVGAGMAREESDIDFFIVAEKNRIWIVRFFTNLILRLFGLRTYGAHQRDRICLSFYVDSAHLDLAPWRISPDDIHFAYWLNMMTPIYDPENYYAKFLQANKWTDKYIPNCNVVIPAKAGIQTTGSPIESGMTVFGRIWKRAWEAMWRGSYGDIIEKEAKGFQMVKMKLSLKEKAKLPDNGVVIADGVLKFHENDTRLAIRQKWLEKLKLLNC